MQFGERIGNVFQEDQAENNVLVLGSIHVVAEFVGSRPERGLKAEIHYVTVLL